MSHILAAKAAHELNEIYSSSTATIQSATPKFKAKYGAVNAPCGTKIHLKDGSTISLHQASARWSVDLKNIA